MRLASTPLMSQLFANAICPLLLLLSAFAAAQSTIDFRGELDIYLRDYQAAGADSDSVQGIESNGMTTSWLGAYGEHILNDDLKAIAAVEMFFRPDSAEAGRFEDDLFFARSAYVGLSGNFGEVKVGRVAAAHFISAISFNPFGDSFAFSPMILMSYGGGGLYGDTGWSDSVVYTTPELGGFTSNLAYAFGEKQGDSGTNKIGANTFFKSGNFGLTAAAQKISGPQTGATGLGVDDEQTTSLVGVSYDIGKSTLFAQYQMMRDELAFGDIDRDTLVLSASIAAGPGALYLSYGFTETSVDDADTDRSIYTLVYNLPLGKETDLYAGFTSDDPDGVEQKGRTLGLGGRYRF
jgi:predicted porin